MLLYLPKIQLTEYLTKMIKDMKKSSLLKLFAMALLLFMAVNVAQDGYAQTIRNSSNSTVGKIESDGTIRNSSNSYIGKIESNGDIRDSSNRLIGKISSNGEVRNSSNSYIGKIESDGTVRNSSNSYMGKVESDGTVRNSSNSTIGYARGVPMRYAALYFFFNLL